MFRKFCCLLLWTFIVKSFAVVGVERRSAGPSDRHPTERSLRKTASIGNTKILECEIEYPGGKWTEHIITWRKQSIEVPIFIQFNGYPPHIDPSYQGRVRLVEGASIELSDIRTSDQGWYECSIVFVDGTDDTTTNGTWIYLTVNSPPVLGEVSPSFLIQKEGDTVDLFCEASATPQPTLTWFKDNKELRSSDTVVIHGNRVQLRGVVRTDGGVYSCIFKNTVGRVSHIIKLIIEGKDWIETGNAYIMMAPKNTTVREGARVKLTCQADGFPSNITYQWLRNDIDVQKVSGLMARAMVYADGSFVVTTVIKEDSGWYKCRPTNGIGSPPEASAYLNVTYLPRVLSMPMQLYLPLGMMGRIECPIEANPAITQVVWTKDGHVVNFATLDRLKLTRQGTLVIETVVAADDGTYTCTPYSPIGAGKSSPPVQVNVRDPPYFSVRPQPVYQRVLGQTVTLPCVAEGDPKPTIVWRKVNSAFPMHTSRNDGNLTINGLAKIDYGVYECIATNKYTSIITSTLVIIETTTPHAPYNLSVSTTQFAATISWLPGYNGGFRQHYVLWYRMQDGSQQRWMTIRVIPAKATSITVYKLYPDMMYQFMVLSRNQLGDGFFSEIVAIKTKDNNDKDGEEEKKPEKGYDPLLASALPTDKYGKTYIPPIIKTIGPKPAPPRNLTVRQLRTGLFISWLPPYDLTVPVQYYKVYYRTVGPWVPLTGEITDKTTYLWKTVSRGATYQFQVYSYSKLAHSEPSKPVAYSTIDTKRKGVQMSMAFVGVVIGGVFSVFTAIMLLIMCIKYYFRRRQRKNAKKYGNVKYFGPNQVDSNSIRFTGKFRTTRGGRSPVDSNTRRHGGVSTLYHSAWRCLLGVRRSLRLCRHHGDTQSEWELYEGQAKEPLAPIYRTVEGKFVFGNIYSSSGPQPVEELADVLTQKDTERVNHNYNEVSPRDLSATLCPVSSRGDRRMCVTSSPQYDADRGRFFLNDVSSIALLPLASDNWSPDPSQVKDSLYREMSNNLNLFRESQWQKHNSASWLSDYKYCWSGAPPGAYCQKVTRYPQGSSVTVQDNGTGSSTSSRPVMYTRDQLSHTIDKVRSRGTSPQTAYMSHTPHSRGTSPQTAYMSHTPHSRGTSPQTAYMSRAPFSRGSSPQTAYMSHAPFSRGTSPQTAYMYHTPFSRGTSRHIAYMSHTPHSRGTSPQTADKSHTPHSRGTSPQTAYMSHTPRSRGANPQTVDKSHTPRSRGASPTRDQSADYTQHSQYSAQQSSVYSPDYSPGVERYDK